MPLNKVPPIRPPKGVLYATAASLATFIFWFTRLEPEPTTTKRTTPAGTNPGAPPSARRK